jgi:hypothetical protein
MSNLTPEQIGAAVGTAVAGVMTAFFTVLIVGTLFAFPIMWMWDYVMPELFGLTEITFWQAFWGTVMVRLISNGIKQ